MSDFEVLEVRFHFNGEFVHDGSKVEYCNGLWGISHVEKDKISIPELEGNLLDHTKIPGSVRMYWLPFGAEVSSGMTLLVDDKSCLDMINELGGASNVDIYTEACFLGRGCNQETTETQYGDDEVFAVFQDENIMDLDAPAPLMVQHNDKNGNQIEQDAQILFLEAPINVADEQADEHSEEEEESESAYDATGFTSDEDDETKEIRAKLKDFMSKVRKRGDIPIDTGIELDVIQGIDANNNAQLTTSGDGILYFDSDDDASYDEDSDGVSTRRKCRYPIFDSRAETPHFAVDMCFRGKDELKDAIERYALKMKVNIRFVKNDRQRLRATCRWKGCPWVLYASYNSRTDWFQIVTYNPNHACCPELKNKRLSTNRICDKYESTIKANPAWKARSMKETVQEDMGVDVSITMIKRAKARVMKKIMDTQSGEYSKLFDYALELKRSNPGTTVHVALDPEEEDHIFQRMYICFDACRRGFLDGCRRVIGLDGCFLKGPLKGELLSAVGRDANNQIHPIAWAVVEYENKDSWNWFLGHLQKDINIPIGAAGWVFITDQQKGLLSVINKLFPAAEHRMCARHIYANWRKKHRLQEYQKRFWKIAKAPNELMFKHYKNKLAKITPKGWEDLEKTDPVHWSRAWFRLGSNCESVDNNMSESFNSWIIEARFKPIISMLEDIRVQVTRRIQENRSNSERWKMAVCPNIIRKVNKIRHRTQFCHVVWNGAAGFEVREKKWRYTVNLENKTCSCRYWQVSGIPCQHACAAMFKMAEEPNNYIHTCFSIDEYKKTYQHVMQPVEHESAWPVSPNPKPLPPRVKKMPGRPKKKRRKDASEPVKSSTRSSKVGTKSRCRRCKNLGHNSRTCSVQMEQTGSHNPAPQTTNLQGAPSTEPTNARSESGPYRLPLGQAQSFPQSGHKRRKVSFSRVESSAEASAMASAGGSASVVIETNAGTTTGTIAKATINVKGGHASAKIQSSSLGRGSASGQSSSQQKSRKRRMPANYTTQ